MDYGNVVVFILLGLVFSGFVYVNFIFPAKVKREKEENKK